MENQRYMREGLDLKRLFLLMRKKLWIPAAATALGALLGGGIYLLFHLVLLPEREYESVGKFYLNFNCEPEDYNQLSYNGYTWNDLMDTDPILDYMMQELPENIARETAAAATEAEILSDIRLLTVTVTEATPELTSQIMEAVGASLVHLGETDPLFHSIEIYGVTKARQILWDNRTLSAVVTGGILALFCSIMGLAFWYVLDDSVYVEKDVEQRYGIPVLGIFSSGTQGEEGRESAGFYANYSYLCRGLREVALLSVDSREDAEAAGQAVRKMLTEEIAGNKGLAGEEGKGGIGGKGQPPQVDKEKETVPDCLIFDMPETAEDYRRLREKDGVILAIHFGGRNGKAAERVLSQLMKQDCVVCGVLVVGADRQFLKSYYGRGI